MRYESGKIEMFSKTVQLCTHRIDVVVDEQMQILFVCLCLNIKYF